MSDVLTKYKRLCLIKELRDVQIIESEFHYAFNRNCDAILRLKIPFPVLRFWNGLVKGGEIVVVSFVDLLGIFLVTLLYFVDDVEVRTTINEPICKLEIKRTKNMFYLL